MVQFQRVAAKKIGKSAPKGNAADDKHLEQPQCKQCDRTKNKASLNLTQVNM